MKIYFSLLIIFLLSSGKLLDHYLGTFMPPSKVLNLPGLLTNNINTKSILGSSYILTSETDLCNAYVKI